MREYAGGRPSLSSVARRPSPCTPTLLGTEGVLRCCVCCVVDFCLYAAVLRMERCADLVSGFFGTYSGTLCRSAIWFWDSSIFMIVRCADLVPVFWILWYFFDVCFCPMLWLFSCRLEASARGRWHRAGLLRRRGDYYLGCGRRRYCGRVCCLSRRRVLALPQCF